MRPLHSIFLKLFVSFLLLSALPLLLFGYYTYSNFTGTLNEKLNQNASSILDQRSLTLSSFMNDLERMGNSIAASSTVSDFLKNTSDDKYPAFFAKMDELIQSIQLIRPENIGITIVSDHQFAYYYGYSYNRDVNRFASYSWLSEAASQSGNAYISTFHARPYSNYESDITVFSYVKRLSSFSMKSGGVLVIDFRVDLFNRWFDAGNSRKNADSEEAYGVFVTNGPGQVLYPYSSDQGNDTRLKWDNPDEYKLIRHRDAATGWTITAYFEKSKFYQPVASIQRQTILFAIVSAFVCLFASFFISRKLSNPIRTLTKLMKHVGQGDFNLQFNIRRKDEIGALSVGFNYMVTRIRDLIGQVHSEQHHKRRAEVAALQSQIKPHFIYNTLETINAMARKKNETEISKLIVLLGRLLRMSISTFDDMIPIAKELEYAQYYLDIHKFRQRKMFEYTIDIAPELDRLYMVKWIVQPVIENAIIHGIEPSPEGGRIDISGWLDGDDVFIRVSDEGVGMNNEELQLLQYNLEHHAEQLTKRHNKVGLYNVQSRIRMHCGKSYGLWLESARGAGLTVTIKLPRRMTNEPI